MKCACGVWTNRPKNDNYHNNGTLNTTQIDGNRFVAMRMNEWYNHNSNRKAKRRKKWAKLGSLCVCVSFWKQRKCQTECETKRFQNGHNQIGKNYVQTHTRMEWAKKINNNNSSSNSTDTGVDERVNAWNFAFTIFLLSRCAFALLASSLIFLLLWA